MGAVCLQIWQRGVAQPRHQIGVIKKGPLQGKVMKYLPKVTNRITHIKNQMHPVVAWKSEVKRELLIHRSRDWPVKQGVPVGVILQFARSMPKKKTAFWTQKPDYDNLSKAALDAMSGTVFQDDAQVCVSVCTKRIEDDRTEIMLLWGEDFRVFQKCVDTLVLSLWSLVDDRAPLGYVEGSVPIDARSLDLLRGTENDQ